MIAHLESQFPNSLVRSSPEESVIVINLDKIPTAVLQAEVDFMRSCSALPKKSIGRSICHQLMLLPGKGESGQSPCLEVHCLILDTEERTLSLKPKTLLLRK